jgi:hypothetical protein
MEREKGGTDWRRGVGVDSGGRARGGNSDECTTSMFLANLERDTSPGDESLL